MSTVEESDPNLRAVTDHLAERGIRVLRKETLGEALSVGVALPSGEERTLNVSTAFLHRWSAAQIAQYCLDADITGRIERSTASVSITRGL